MSTRPPVPTLGRRALIEAGVAAGATALLPWVDAPAEVPQIPRNRMAVVSWGGREGRWVDWDVWNP